MPLYLLGRQMRAFYPVVPLARNQALGIAIMSYDGRLAFGLQRSASQVRRSSSHRNGVRRAAPDSREDAGPHRARSPESPPVETRRAVRIAGVAWSPV
jgi:hypothetical protein